MFPKLTSLSWNDLQLGRDGGEDGPRRWLERGEARVSPDP